MQSNREKLYFPNGEHSIWTWCYERALESIGRNQLYRIESENENLINLHCASALYTRNRENRILTN